MDSMDRRCAGWREFLIGLQIGLAGKPLAVLTQALAARFKPPGQPRTTTLTQVVELWNSGMDGPQIQELLDVSRDAVHTNLYRARNKGMYVRPVTVRSRVTGDPR